MVDKTEIQVEGHTFKSAEPQEYGYCFGCAFYAGEFAGLCGAACKIQTCTPVGRADGKHIIWMLAE